MDYQLIGVILRMSGYELIKNLYTHEYMVYNLSNLQMTPLIEFLQYYFLNNMYILLNLCPYGLNCNNYYCRYNHIQNFNTHMPTIQQNLQPPFFIPYNAMPIRNIDTQSPLPIIKENPVPDIKTVNITKSRISTSLPPKLKNKNKNKRSVSLSSDKDTNDWTFF